MCSLLDSSNTVCSIFIFSRSRCENFEVETSLLLPETSGEGEDCSDLDARISKWKRRFYFQRHPVKVRIVVISMREFRSGNVASTSRDIR